MTTERKQEIINQYRRDEKDTEVETTMNESQKIL